MNRYEIALTDDHKRCVFGNFVLPMPLPSSVTVCTHAAIAALVPLEYKQGRFFYCRNSDQKLQKIQVFDIIWSLWGTADDADNSEALVQLYLAGLAGSLENYNEFSTELLQHDVMTFYSDNPEYPPDTVPRVIVCRLSRLADFE